MPQNEIASQIAVHGSRCWLCESPLTGKQERFCSTEHKDRYWSGIRKGTIERKRMNELTDDGQIIAYQGEMMLLGWSETHAGGRKVTFQLPEDGDEHPFKPATVAKGKTAGQRYMVVCIEIGDDERPKPQPEQKGGPLAKLAGMMCADQKFWEWLNETSDMEVRDWLEDGIINEKDARNAILYVCGIESRRELDHNPEAARIFHEQIRLPYMNWLERQAR